MDFILIVKVCWIIIVLHTCSLKKNFLVIITAGVIPTAESQFLDYFKATKVNCENTTELLKAFPLPALQSEHPHGLCGA